MTSDLAREEAEGRANIWKIHGAHSFQPRIE